MNKFLVLAILSLGGVAAAQGSSCADTIQIRTAGGVDKPAAPVTASCLASGGTYTLTWKPHPVEKPLSWTVIFLPGYSPCNNGTQFTAGSASCIIDAKTSDAALNSCPDGDVTQNCFKYTVLVPGQIPNDPKVIVDKSKAPPGRKKKKK